jgi:hypothetical protein
MASILRVDTLTDASSNNSIATSVLFNGSNKAWINLNGSSTIANRDSYNISGITDNGTGDYTETFTNSMANANYSPACVVQDDQSDTGNMGGTAATIYRASTGLATGNCRIGTGVAGTSTRNDDTTLSIIIAGDLA